MTEYAVAITPEAEADLENIWGYIAYELEAGESTCITSLMTPRKPSPSCA